MINFYTEFKTNLTEIRDQYPFLNRFGDAWALAIYHQIQEGQLNEFVLSTVPVDKTISHVIKKYPKFPVIREGTFGDIEVVFSSDSMWDVEGLIKFMDSFGWFPSVLFTGPKEGGKFSEDYLNRVTLDMAKNRDASAILVFEKKFNEQQQVQPFYFHISLDIYHDEIMKVGLIPRSHSKLSAHPQRIYLLNPTSQDYIRDIGFVLLDKAKPEIKSKVKSLSVYKIDTSKVANLEVYEDENFLIGDGAVWTQKNIPPKAIEHIGFIQVQE
jgi:hypothetical protein